MYSVVLLAALTTGGATPDWHNRIHCGCYGACYGSCYAGCYGGCHGRYWWGAGNGGYDCMGYRHNCWGSCHGFYASFKSYGYAGDLNGGHGCYGCYGCYGGCYGTWGPGYGCYGPALPHAPEVVPPPEVIPPPSTGGDKDAEDKGSEDKGKDSVSRKRARVIVKLPEGARLFVDDQEIKTVSTRQSFRTPALDQGTAYYYEVRAEVMRDGKPVQEMRRVIVQAGQVAEADFSHLAPPATVTARAR
jgi:uncharacterized protein (TIGR03000 family)